MARLRVGVLISGRGSNLQALIAACSDPAFPAEIVTVLSNKAGAPGLAFARATGIPAVALDATGFADRTAFDREIDRHLVAARVEMLCLAGYMRLLSDAFLKRWRDRVVNIHPSLLPAFRGLNAPAQALTAGVRIAGCTVHFVRPEMDSGPIIGQAAVPILGADTPTSLAERILAAEHRLYPLVLRLLAEGRVHIAGDRVTLEGADASGTSIMYPGRDGP